MSPMLSADAVSTVSAPAATSARRSAHKSLSRKLVWLTVAAVLIAEVLFFLPSLTRARHDWLERRLREGQLAALSAGDGTLTDGLRSDLLRLAGVEAVVLTEPGTTLRVARQLAQPGVMAEDARRLDLAHDSPFAALCGAIGGLFRTGDALLRVQGPGWLGEGTQVTVLVHRSDLDQFLALHARRVGTISLVVAATAGVLLYGALMLLLVRPLRRLTENIAAFRTDPERAATFDPAEAGGDEIAVAGRELAAMQRELRAALWRNARLAALGAAVAKISHDLRGILSPAMLTAERLQMSQDPSIKRAGDTLVRAVERATELVRRTVEYAREPPAVPPRQRMALRPAVSEAAEQTRLSCPDLAIDNAVPAETEIDGDHASIVRVFANLLRNAGEARARTVRVMAEEEAGHVVVTVTDDGPGLPEAVQAALFRPFITGGRPGGTGLGLAIVRDLVRAHGGEASLAGTGPTGTIFRLTFPRAARPALRPEPAPRPMELRG
jgi:signal transduction histidine kinase